MVILQKGNDIENWLNNVCGSERTREYYMRIVKEFEKRSKQSLASIVEEWYKVKYDWEKNQRFQDELSELMQSYYSTLRGYASLSRHAKIVPILSFFKFKRISVAFNFEKHSFVTYHNRDLKKEDIQTILEHSLLRDRCFYLMMLESGNRPETLTRLQYKLIKEDYEANKVPMKIDLPSAILKGRVSARWSFIGEDGFRTLKEYLKNRVMKDEDYLFPPIKFRNDRSKKRLNPNTFSSQFSRTVTSLGLAKKTEKDQEGYGKPRPVRLYGLRKYYRNNMRCESSFREFWMGHGLKTDEHYISREIERHREEYLKGYASLRIYEPDQDINALRKRILDQEEQMKKLNEENSGLYQKVEAVRSENDKRIEALRNEHAEQAQKVEALTNLVKEWYPENTIFEKDGKVYERTCEGINEKGKLIIRTRERPDLHDTFTQLQPILDEKLDVTPEEKKRIQEVFGKQEKLREKMLHEATKKEDEKEDEIVKEEEAEDENDDACMHG
jgi:hypothetical protein